MKMSTKFFIAAVILFILPTKGITQLIAFLCITAGIALLIVQGVTEITGKNKTPSEKDYAEARKAYEDVIKKQKKNTKAPWEE